MASKTFPFKAPPCPIIPELSPEYGIITIHFEYIFLKIANNMNKNLAIIVKKFFCSKTVRLPQIPDKILRSGR